MTPGGARRAVGFLTVAPVRSHDALDGAALTWFPAYLAVATMRDTTAYRRLYAVGLGLSFVLLLGATWAVSQRQWVA